MNVSCPECRSVYRVDPAKVTGVTLRARCTICGGLIPVGASVRWADDFPSSTLRGHAAGAAPETPEGPATAVPPANAVHVSTPPSAMPQTLDVIGGRARDVLPPVGAGSGEPVAPRGAPFAPAKRPTPVTPALGAPATRPAPSPSPAVAPALEAQPAMAPPVPTTLRPPTPAFVPSPALGGASVPGGVRERSLAPDEAGRTALPARPASSPPAGPVSGASPTSAASPLATVTPTSSPAAAPPGATSRPGSPSAPARRPINPFLSNDPNQKARRLARALVSDMVAYHPQKREEGARNGTLKQLFREEIKKSYEEYVEQVGREFAESTTHFQEALNDILAGGKRIF